MDVQRELPAKRSLAARMGRVLLWLVTGLFLAAGSLVALAFAFENDVKAAVIRELNKRLLAEVKVSPENIDLTVISSFPYCSVRFNRLLVLEALKQKKRDTLLYCGRLDLFFNISDLWNKRYGIEALRIVNGVIKPRILADGSNNFTAWKTDTVSGESDVRFQLRLLSMEDMRLAFTDESNRLMADAHIGDLTLGGDFSASAQELEATASFRIRSFESGKRRLLRDKNLKIDFLASARNGTYTIKNGIIDLNELRTETGARLVYSDRLESADLDWKAKDLDLQAIVSLLPDKYREKFRDYRSDGSFFADGSLNWRSAKSYTLGSRFGVKGGTIAYRPGDISAENIALNGSLMMTALKSELRVSNIRAELEGDSISGSLVLNDFGKPIIGLEVSSRLDLSKLQRFYPVDTLDALNGKAKIELALRAPVADLSEKRLPPGVQFSLAASFHSLEAKFRRDPQAYAIEQCSLSVNDREVEVKGLVIRRGASDLRIDGKIPGLLAFILEPGHPLNITGRLRSANIRMEDFLAEATGSKDDTAAFFIPAYLNLDAFAEIGSFSFGKFSASSLSGDLEIRNRKAMVEEMRFSAMEGRARVSALADNSKGDVRLSIQADVTHINLRELFTQMNNFGQQTLTDANLKGYASATVETTGRWSADLAPDNRALRASCDLVVEKGELIGFAPLSKLSKYMDVEDLRHIRFATLRSHVDIAGEAIAIRRTVIDNSALNVDFCGTHGFDNRVDYHFRMLMSDVMARKFKRQEEFGPERDPYNRRSLHITMRGDLDDPEFEYDKKGMKEKIREDMKLEGKELRTLFREEFGLFKKDSLPPKKKEPEAFTFEKTENPPPKKTLEPKKRPVEDDF